MRTHYLGVTDGFETEDYDLYAIFGDDRDTLPVENLSQLTSFANMDDAQIEKMREAGGKLVGKKDFSSFMAEGSKIVDTVRCIEYLTVNKSGNLIEIKVAADGFLYNMVRIIVGTLVDVAFDRICIEEIDNIILAHDRSAAGQTAPPQGLYLNKVVY